MLRRQFAAEDSMHNYQVYEASTDKSQIALSDDVDRCHVGRPTADAPAFGAKLVGPSPRLGLSVLLCVQTGRIFRIIFELIDSDRQSTIERLHPRLTL
jgi:hypothetical protein